MRKLVSEVAKRGVDGAEECCAGLNDNTIKATLRWYDGKTDVSSNLLAWKLREGGIYVPDDEAPAKSTIWTEAVQLIWIEAHMPEEIEKDYGFRAGVAIVGIVRAGLSVSVERVRDFMRGELISEDAV